MVFRVKNEPVYGLLVGVGLAVVLEGYAGSLCERECTKIISMVLAIAAGRVSEVVVSGDRSEEG